MRTIGVDITLVIVAPRTFTGIDAETAGYPGATFIVGTPLALTFRPHGRKFIITLISITAVGREGDATIGVPWALIFATIALRVITRREGDSGGTVPIVTKMTLSLRPANAVLVLPGNIGGRTHPRQQPG